jgi:hypothetical protein
MWLINTSTGELTAFFDGAIPDYAILSHTWRSNNLEEVLFADLKLPLEERKKKPGYAKVEGFLKAAYDDGYEWAWLDTMSIDKSSSAELSEAINSMYKWYEKSRICYVLLEDVEWLGESDTASMAQLKASRWFTRGWTLQELLAPSMVLFYDKDWNEIGTRESLHDVIEQVTNIDEAILLQNRILRSCTIAERMSWAANRRTSRAEDMAYCLMGLFDVNMPLLYGEGGAKAFQRLQMEIITATDDLSFLAWTKNDPWDFSVLASDPSRFLSPKSNPDCDWAEQTWPPSGTQDDSDDDEHWLNENNKELQWNYKDFRLRSYDPSNREYLSFVKDEESKASQHSISMTGRKLRMTLPMITGTDLVYLQNHLVNTQVLVCLSLSIHEDHFLGIGRPVGAKLTSLLESNPTALLHRGYGGVVLLTCKRPVTLEYRSVSLKHVPYTLESMSFRLVVDRTRDLDAYRAAVVVTKPSNQATPMLVACQVWASNVVHHISVRCGTETISCYFAMGSIKVKCWLASLVEHSSPITLNKSVEGFRKIRAASANELDRSEITLKDGYVRCTIRRRTKPWFLLQQASIMFNERKAPAEGFGDAFSVEVEARSSRSSSKNFVVNSIEHIASFDDFSPSINLISKGTVMVFFG